jgi:hypothetical protein
VIQSRANANVFSVRCFHPEDGGEPFLRNVGSYKNHAATHPRRRHSSIKFSGLLGCIKMAGVRIHYEFWNYVTKRLGRFVEGDNTITVLLPTQVNETQNRRHSCYEWESTL